MVLHIQTPPARVLPLSAPAIGELARAAAEAEATASPKPGLVCPGHQGAHTDMDYALFLRSAAALQPYFTHCATIGAERAARPAPEVLPALQQAGLAAEAAMFAATGGVNTHKGLIYSLGLVCAGLARSAALNQARSAALNQARSAALNQARSAALNQAPLARITAQAVLCEAAALADKPVTKHLLPLRARHAPHGPSTGIFPSLTAGERLYLAHGITGIRGEAEAGFPSVLMALGCLLRARTVLPPAAQLPQTLLWLMAVTKDSNVLARGGLRGLQRVQTGAKRVLELGGMGSGAGRVAMAEFSTQCAQERLSPGGCADMLAVAVFLRDALGLSVGAGLANS